MKTIEPVSKIRILESQHRGSLEFEAPNKTKKDVAEFLGVTVRTVEAMMVRSGLPFYRLGTRRVRFRLSDVLKWMDERNRVS
jgi:excisionase family DNA binding protein